MIRNPKDLQRYNAEERANHWVVGICFILLGLSGLAFFHPAFYPLSQLFGGGVWAPNTGAAAGKRVKGSERVAGFIMVFGCVWQKTDAV